MSLIYKHLEGLAFDHGKQDCYEAIRSFWRDNFGVALTNYARPNDWWDKPGLDLYIENLEREGFRLIDIPLKQLRRADLIFMSIQSKTGVANHAAVYVGNNEIFHHFWGRPSVSEPFTGLWRNTHVALARHKDVDIPNEPPEAIDLMDRLPPHVRQRLLPQAG